MSKVSPEIPKLGETDSEWRLGLFGIDKTEAYRARAWWTWPRWRDHTSNPVTANMRLRVEAFDRTGGDKGFGVVLVVPEESFEQYVGWVGAARADQLRTWVAFMNAEIAALWALWDAAGRPRGNTPPATPPLAVSAPPSTGIMPLDERIGRRLAGGRFEVLEWLGNDSVMGAATGRDHEDGSSVRLTFARDVAGSADDLREAWRAMFRISRPSYIWARQGVTMGGLPARC